MLCNDSCREVFELANLGSGNGHCWLGWANLVSTVTH